MKIGNLGGPTDGTDFSVGFYISADPIITISSDALLYGGRTFVVDPRSHVTKFLLNFIVASGGIANVVLTGASVLSSPICGAGYFGILVNEYNYINETTLSNNYASVPVTVNCAPTLPGNFFSGEFL